MRITVLAGGVGAARFLRGLKAAAPGAQITVIGNTGDDITLFGLRVCPDLDTVMYTLGGGISEEQGWGRAVETFTIRDELRAYGAGPSWFTLGDRDFATHIVRTQLLTEGKPLSEVTRVLCERWQPGVRLLPMSDDTIETHVVLRDSVIHFQEWWVRLHAPAPAEAIVPVGAAEASPAPGVAEAIAGAARSAPCAVMASAGTAACSRTHHSWKWITDLASSSIRTCVSILSSDIGRSRTPGCQRSHSTRVTSDSGAP